MEPTSKRALVAMLVVLLFAAGCAGLDRRTDAAAAVKHVNANGVRLATVEHGRGVPVVFVHGSVSDWRAWNAQRQAVGERYRFIAYSMRYHGTEPWSDDGRNYSVATHAADLAALIRSLNAGPVFVVGQSLGALTALLMSVQHPELVRGLVINEPPNVSIIAGLDEAKQILGEGAPTFAARNAAGKAGDGMKAMRILIDWVLNLPPGGFDTLPEETRAMLIDNARTEVPAVAAPPPPPITCDRLTAFRVPTLVTGGADTRRFFSLINETTARCIPGSRLVVIPDADHSAMRQNSAAFNAALLEFLSRH